MSPVALLVVSLVAVAVLALIVVLAVRVKRRGRVAQVEVCRRSAALARELAPLFAAIQRELRPGVSTAALEQRVAHLLEARGLRGYLKGYQRFPGVASVSVNDGVINTVPNERPLAEGDLVKVQVGVSDGVAYVLQAWTLVVGSAADADRKLLDGARAALRAAVRQVRAGVSTAEVTGTIHAALDQVGLRPSRDHGGYQVGAVPRKPPRIPCASGLKGEPPATALEQGMVLHLLVVAHAGDPTVSSGADSLNVVTVDGSRSALFSHVVVVGRREAEVLTSEPT